VLPEAVEEKVAAVASDHQSGATHMAERALRAFDLLFASGEADRDAVRELARRLEEAQPAMSSVRHVARLAARVMAETPNDWPGFRDAMQRELEGGRRKAARNFLKLLAAPATILTLSRSTNVFECLGLAHGKGFLQQVFVLESRPLREGVEFARDLHEAGVPVAVIADGAAGAFIAQATMGLEIGRAHV
jgi:translation initiation factor 2B subunit (eIF-2B alpha/beta/delta family)